MPTRRQVLIGTSAIALAQLAGCGWRGASLRVRLLQNSLPPQVVGAFEREVGSAVSMLAFQPAEQLRDVVARLDGEQTDLSWWQRLTGLGRPPVPAHFTTLGDVWLSEAIANGRIQPFDPSGIAGWEQLPQAWRDIVRRDEKGRLAPQGKLWGAPYRWGTTAIAYRADKLENAGIAPPRDWEDLWRPELRDRISLLNQPREAIGLTLKKLGASYNTPDLDRVPELERELAALHANVKFYSDAAYLQPLILGHTWVAVGWSADFLSLRARYPDIKTVLPASGTALWSDLWVRPAAAEFSDLSDRWLAYCWDADTARQISLLGDAASPILLTLDPGTIPEAVRAQPLLSPDPAVLARCEFLEPLENEKQYLDLWRTLRSS